MVGIVVRIQGVN